MNTYLLINNQDVNATGGATFERRNPFNGEPATKAAAAALPDVLAAAHAAQAALPQWAALGPSERRGLLLQAAEQLQRRQADFVQAMLSETGATPAWAGFNVMLAANMLREAAALTTRAAGAVIPSDRPGGWTFCVRQPAGVVLGIAPWNAPVILGVRAIATPLACGNTVILKASELCPRTHTLIGAALRDAGFPAGVVNVVTNAPADAAALVAALIAHPAVRRINFTGSTRVGRSIAEAAARQLKPVLLELGGKAPLVVLDDADLEAAVAAAVFGAFMNQGQICMSTEKIVIHHSIADAFLTRLVARAGALAAGDPAADDVVLGSLSGHEAVRHLRELMDDALAKGATLALRGKVQGTVVGAHVLDHVNRSMRIYHEESFGPVVSMIRVKDDAEALLVANDSEYGLSSAIFSRDLARALNLARQIGAGMCHINGPTVHDEAQMPFGGMQHSGYGRFGGDAGIAEFTDLRTITLTTQPVHYPF